MFSYLLLIEELVMPKFILFGCCCHLQNEKRKISLCFFPHIFLLGHRTAIVTFPNGQMDCWREETENTSCHLPVPLRLWQPRPRKCKPTPGVFWENVAGCCGGKSWSPMRIWDTSWRGLEIFSLPAFPCGYMFVLIGAYQSDYGSACLHIIECSFHSLWVSSKCRLVCSVNSISHQPSV